MALPDDEAERIADELAAEIDRLAGVAVQQALAEIMLGKQAREAVAAALQAFAGAYEAELARRFGELLQQSIGIDEVRAMPIGGIPLSSKLYLHTQQTSAQVAAIVQDHVNGIHQARALALRLYDGYDQLGAADRPLEGRARADLPRELLALTRDAKTRKSLEDLILKGAAKAKQIRTPALRAAYSEAFDAWAKGKGDAELRRKVDIAMREKTRYMANRIARTEIARAHQAQVGREIMADDAIEVVQVMLNPAHSITDICFREGTRISTKQGAKPIESVEVGDFVLTHLNRWMPVVRLYRSQVKAGGTLLQVSIRPESGELLQVVMTPNHPVLTPKGWTQAGDLKTGCRVALSPSTIDFHRPSDGASGTEPSSSGESLTSPYLKTCAEALCDEPQAIESSRKPHMLSRCSSVPICERSSAGYTRQTEDRHLSSLGFLPLCGSLTRTAGTPESAQTYRGVASHDCRCSRQLTSTELSSTASHGQPEQTSFCMKCTHGFCIVESNISEPEIWSESLNCIDDMFSESCLQSYITSGVIASIDTLVTDGEFVFNLEVDEDHTYVAEGVVVHNCDLHAKADLYGLGPGCYPKALAPQSPFHSFCWCRARPRRTISAAMARELPGGVAAYLRRLPVEDAARIAGSRERLQRILDGESMDDVLNAGKDRAYHLRRLGDPPANTIGTNK